MPCKGVFAVKSNIVTAFFEFVSLGCHGLAVDYGDGVAPVCFFFKIVFDVINELDSVNFYPYHARFSAAETDGVNTTAFSKTANNSAITSPLLDFFIFPFLYSV